MHIVSTRVRARRRRLATLAAGSLACSLVAIAAPPAALPASAATVADVMAWAPYWESTDALNSFNVNKDQLSELTPFFWAARGVSAIESTDPDAPTSSRLEAYRSAANSAAKPLVATIVDGMARLGMRNVLSTEPGRIAHAQAIVDFAVAKNVAGIDIDYEQFAFADGKTTWGSETTGTYFYWGDFITRLADGLHAVGKTLAVAVPPIYDNGMTNNSGYWVYNYPVLAAKADRIRIMTYSYSGNAGGPIAPYDWVKNSIEAALDVPGMVPSKIVLGIAAYGNDVITKIEGSCPTTVTSANELRRKSVTTASAPTHAASKGVEPVWGGNGNYITASNSNPQEKVFSYVDSFQGADSSGVTVRCNIYRKVWYSDHEAIHRRVLLAQELGVAGVAMWALGYDDSATWVAIGAARSGVPYTPPAPIPPNPTGNAVVAPYPTPIYSAGPLPGRFLDTRAGEKTADGLFQGGGRQEADTTLVVQIAGRGAVPADAKAATLNVTALGAGNGYVTVYPCDTPRPLTSSLNVRSAQTISNSVVTRLSATGTVCLYTQSPAHLLVDVFNILPASTFAALSSPSRLVDTRAGESTIDGQFAGVGVLAQGSTLVVPVAGRGGMAATVTSAVLNVTAVGAAGNGYLTVWPCDGPQPATSNVNFSAGVIIPNAVITDLSASGTVCVFASSTTHVVVDTFGALDPASYKPLVEPARLLETRTGFSTFDGQFNEVGKLTAGAVLEIPIAGRGGLSADAEAVVLNVTVDAPALAGFVTLYPCGTARPLVSNVNFAAGQTLPNLVVSKLSGTSICLYTHVATHVIIDAFGTLDL